jgi:pyruvate dehydrogenase E2 component (dihydrolipoamide acetyltransferase)
MPDDIVMPRLSDSMEEGTVLRWLKSVGDEVAVGEELVEIETDKANMVYEADADGTLIEIVADEGDTLPIGQVIARVGEPGEAPSGDGAAAERRAEEPAAKEPAAKEPAAETEVTDTVAEVPETAEAAPAPTPGVRERPETAKGEVEVIELSRIQQTIARRMAESKATAPHFYLEAEIDMSRAVAARTKLKAAAKEGDVVPSFNDMVVKASAIALREFPRANGAYRDGRIEQYSRVNVGVAVAARDALIVPTVFDADLKGLRQIAAETRTLAQRVRDGSVTPPELSGGTFAVSTLGMYGISNFSAVINPPQAAILSVGEIQERPVVRDGEITTAHLMGVTLVCDHRILYGADGAEFLGRIRELLEEPLGLAL